MEIAGWLDQFFPRIAPDPERGTCWLANTKTRSSEHNPPLHWLGRALDAVDAGDAGDALTARLRFAHGPEACGGQSRPDQAVQDVLSEACAFAWAAAHLGPPRFEPGGEALDSPTLVHIPAHDAYLAAHRLWPMPSMDELLAQLAGHIEQAAGRLPAAAGRIVYVDVSLHPRYAQEVGYRTELTEPVRTAIKHVATERRLGYVLTRPFQWGNAIEAHY